MAAGDGGQFALAVKNWQELFVHKWDTHLKVTLKQCNVYIIIYIPTASAVALPNSFPPGAFPEYRLDCTQLSNGAWHCSPVEQLCDSFVELGVVCKNYEDLYNECSLNCTLPVATTLSTILTNMQVTTQTPTSLDEGNICLSACRWKNCLIFSFIQKFIRLLGQRLITMAVQLHC